ncbi:hypothetical protein Ade02nite_66620 [Paractinoplanes deccanensis]|uniref:Lipoprotein n=1 Tax=Paractinoplanes deccanensis TaxID=113561 RepID=A0ABQ3YDE2_9ACTN|nr:hypothetical protein [Actinoplanes deccanensis]GID78021.1 hypothetical protein Ade02nite_66620 [Actinoplanes deccanensis]
MRRALLAVIAAGALLTGAACDSDANDSSAAAAPTASASPSASPEPDYSADTTLVCANMQKLYSAEMKEFGAAMGKLITYREAKQATEAKKAEDAAAAKLKAVAAKIRTVTAAAEDPEFQAAGSTSAAKVDASAADRAYIKKVKTLKDLNGTIEAQYAEWLSPAAGFCAPS